MSHLGILESISANFHQNPSERDFTIYIVRGSLSLEHLKTQDKRVMRGFCNDADIVESKFVS